jgi:glutamyl-tRNA reductase
MSHSLVVVGLNHRSAPIDLLERLAVSDEYLPKALHDLCERDDVLEAVVLSTCNRIEIYAAVSRFHAGAQDLRNFMSEFCHIAPEDFADQLYTYHDEGAVRHLFRVSAGIDSMVVGESEILGQVRRSFQRASDEGTVHRLLGQAFRQALRVGKRARTETAIGRNPVSVSSAAVELARRAFSGQTLAGKKVIIVGAGKMGTLAAAALAKAGAGDITVINRTEERAVNLADLFEARSLPFEELESAVADADILICSTTAPEALLDRSTIERAMAGRADRPLFIVDIAVPRDVEPGAGEVPGVVLRDIDDLGTVVENNRGSRLVEVSEVEDIVASEVQHFLEWERSTEFGPTAAALIEKADVIRRAEVSRIESQLRDLTPEQREAVEHLTRRLVAKIFHTPLARAKKTSNTKQGSLYLNALRELFELGDQPED